MRRIENKLIHLQDVYVITEHHSIQDVLQHLIYETDYEEVEACLRELNPAREYCDG